MNSASGTEKATELKTLGNECMKNGKFAEAILHYTHAIKLDSNSPQLYSNRSFAFLKMQHYYYALDDAKTAISLDPSWHKAYYRRGEVEFATHHYKEAMESYKKANQIQSDASLLGCAHKATEAYTKQARLDQKFPWVAAGIGLILGVIMVVLDAAVLETVYFHHPVLQTLVSIALSVLGLVIGKAYRRLIRHQNNSLLQPPVDLLPDLNKDAKNDTGKETSQNIFKKKERNKTTKDL